MFLDRWAGFGEALGLEETRKSGDFLDLRSGRVETGGLELLRPRALRKPENLVTV